MSLNKPGSCCRISEGLGVVGERAYLLHLHAPRYEEEVIFRANAENEFVALKKVSGCSEGKFYMGAHVLQSPSSSPRNFPGSPAVTKTAHPNCRTTKIPSSLQRSGRNTDYLSLGTVSLKMMDSSIS